MDSYACFRENPVTCAIVTSRSLGSISTLKFLSNTDVLLSVDVQGRVIVRKLTLQGAGSDDGPESSVDDTAVDDRISKLG